MYIYYITIIERPVILYQLLHKPLSMETFGDLPCFHFQNYDLFYLDKGVNYDENF